MLPLALRLELLGLVVAQHALLVEMPAAAVHRAVRQPVGALLAIHLAQNKHGRRQPTLEQKGAGVGYGVYSAHAHRADQLGSLARKPAQT